MTGHRACIGVVVGCVGLACRVDTEILRGARNQLASDGVSVDYGGIAAQGHEETAALGAGIRVESAKRSVAGACGVDAVDECSYGYVVGDAAVTVQVVPVVQVRISGAVVAGLEDGARLLDIGDDAGVLALVPGRVQADQDDRGRMPMMAMTTRSSIRVKPLVRYFMFDGYL